MPRHTGRCQCGDITFELAADPLFGGLCSCLDCQKASGTGHSTIVAFPQPALTAHGTTTKYTSAGGSGQNVTREFCPRCGSRLFSHGVTGRGVVMVSAAALDDQSIVRPMAAIFQRSKAHWDFIDPNLPAFPETPPMAPPGVS